MDKTDYGEECPRCPDGTIEFNANYTPKKPCDHCGYLPTILECQVCGEKYDKDKRRSCGHDEEDDVEHQVLTFYE